MERVLALDNFSLAESLGDTSEAGQNDAARLQAEARRIRMETRLAKQSVRRVIVAAGWRRALNLWYDAQYEMIYLHKGGGTMCLHSMARNDIEVEEFLEGVVDGLQVEPSEVSEEIQTRLQTLFDELNARSDKLESGMWADALRERRCAIPMSLFYEWGPGTGGKKAGSRIPRS